MPQPAKILVFGEKPALSELTLSKTGAIGGAVKLEKTGKGLEGITVRLWDASWKLVGALTTDSAGEYRFEGVAHGSYIVSVDMPVGHEADSEKCQIKMGPGGTMDATFRLRTAKTIRGRIVDEKLGTPLPGLGVEVFGAKGQRLGQAMTTATGDYEFVNLPHDEYHVQLHQ